MRIRIALLLAGTIIALACGSSPSSPSGMASLNVRITDQPAPPEVLAVLVTFSSVAVHFEEQGWIELNMLGTPSRTCDLKRLEGGANDLLANANGLPVGQLTQVRLVVDEVNLFAEPSLATPSPCMSMLTDLAPSSGFIAMAEVPSGEIKLNHPINLTAENAQTVLVDFDGRRSLHQTGNGQWVVHPVVAITDVY